MQTLPRALTPELLSFCRSIAPADPVFIESRPEPDARPSFCFDNAARKAARSGGFPAYGWAIWHLEGLYFEAEHHGVWQSPEGLLMDVSPQFRDVPKILFLPDPAAVYDRLNFRSNVMQPQAGTPLAAAFVDLAQQRNAIINSYRTGDETAPNLCEADWQRVNAISAQLQAMLDQLGHRTG